MKSTAAARQAIAARVLRRRDSVAAALAAEPGLSTDALAARLGWDRSTIRRDRAALRRRGEG